MKKRALTAVWAVLATVRLAAGTTVRVDCDRPDAVYRVGDEIVFSLTATGNDGTKATAGRFRAGVDNFGPGELVPRRDYDFAETNPVRIRVRAASPGFVRLSANMEGVTNLVWSVAVDPERIRPGAGCPKDFDAFWKAAIRRYDAEVAEDVRLEPLPSLSTKYLDVFKLSLSAPGGRRIYGVFSRPKWLDAGPFPLRFGGKGAGPSSFGCDGKPGRVSLVMNVHYYDAPPGSSKRENEGRQKAENEAWAKRHPARRAEYQLLGIAEGRESYFYYGVILATRRAFEWALRQPYVNRRDVAYSSTSQGGAFGLYMAALCPEIGRLVACVPAMTDLCGFKAGRMSGWPRLIEAQLDDRKDAAIENAPYFDAANFAARVKCPVRFVVGFSDTTCPPTAVYSAYNSLASADRKIIHGIGMTHLVRREYSRELEAWLEGARTTGEGRLNPVFSEGVVLQRERPVRIWGTARAGESVRVSFGGQTKVAKADGGGAWLVTLDPMPASRRGRELVAEFAAERTRQVVGDVLVGEVWICSGQSNMDCPVWGPSPRYRDAWGALTVASTVKPWVRLVKTPKAMAARPRREVDVAWRKMTPELMHHHETGRELPSAVGFYFALEIANALDVPVGVIDASWGGTHIDPWVPAVGYGGIAGLAFERNWKTVPKSEFRKETMVTNMITAAEEQPSVLWNAMVAPYAPLSVRGFLWYQGCQNVREPQRYAAKMRALYNGWSKEFRNPGLRLYFVQLAPWGNPLVPLLQEAQARFAAEEGNAAIAIVNDTGNLHDIHPNDKRTVAKRLAVHALRRDYGYSWLKDDSPVFRSCRREGNRLVLSFDSAEGWYVYNARGSMENGFELCGKDGKWVSAKILNMAKTRRSGGAFRYEGALEGREIELSADGVGSPCAVRYLHREPWFGSLYNEMGLPLGAFRASVPEPDRR